VEAFISEEPMDTPRCRKLRLTGYLSQLQSGITRVSQEGHTATVQALIGAGANLNLQNKVSESDTRR
jgi:hypothetical protein